MQVMSTQKPGSITQKWLNVGLFKGVMCGAVITTVQSLEAAFFRMALPADGVEFEGATILFKQLPIHSMQTFCLHRVRGDSATL